LRFVRTAAGLGLLMAMVAAGQTPRDRKAIAYTKAILVSKLDPKLPSIPFEQWLIKEAGEGAQISWEVNDCGEQTGTAEDQDTDFPMCVEAEARMRDKRVIVISIAVGTYQRGVYGKPVTWWITVGHDPSSDPPLQTLSDVPLKLIGTRGMAPPASIRHLPVGEPPRTEVLWLLHE
jgi:hypothetical protein